MRIHHLQAGAEGCPVLLLHGGGLDAAGLSFQKRVPDLAKRHRVFAPDLPGFGQSDPMHVTWRVEECVELVGRFLDALGLKRASLVGISMGGAFAVGFTLLAPERVERLVLVDNSSDSGALLSSARFPNAVQPPLKLNANTAKRFQIIEEKPMLHYAIVFLVIAIIAAIFGFTGIAGTSAWIAHVLFVLFLVLFVISLIFRGKPSV